MPKPPIQLIVPMSGQGTRYQQAGYREPKPLIPVNGTPMLERLLRNFPLDWPATFVMAENHRATELPALVAALRPRAPQLFIAPHTRGPSHALLAALEAIDESAPVLVSYCDYGMVWDPAQFERFVDDTGCDACLVSYRGFHAHYLSPVMYAYSRMEGERVVEVKEKGSFTEDRETEYASCGAYYFRSGALLRRAIDDQLDVDLQLNGEFYTSLTVEALLRADPSARVRVFEIPYFFQWGTPDDLRNFEYWERTYQALNRIAGRRGAVSQVLMPMAGKGSRFSGIAPGLPKPLIPVDGRPMYAAAIESLPAPERTVIVALDEIAPVLRPTLSEATQLVSLPETPPGQALSTQAGVQALGAGDLIVSACDHAIVLDPARWARFRSRPDCEAAIFTVTGFPGADRRPNAYAYVVPHTTDEPFPEVARVSVKQPVSAHPSADAALVGTFWFASAAIMNEGIEELKRRDVRVNGELYLDSIFALLQQAGRRVRMIPLDGYVGWGEPDAMAEALYWQEVFTSRRIEPRRRYPGLGPPVHSSPIQREPSDA